MTWVCTCLWLNLEKSVMGEATGNSLDDTWNSPKMFHTFLLKFVNSGLFKSFIMTIILINTLTTAFYATFSKYPSAYKLELQVLEILDAVFLAIYTVELALKVWIKPRSFFYNGFNCFDFFVLLLSYSQVQITATDLHVCYNFLFDFLDLDSIIQSFG